MRLELILNRQCSVAVFLSAFHPHHEEPDNSNHSSLHDLMESHDTQHIWGTTPFVIDSTSSTTESFEPLEPSDILDQTRALADILHVTPTGERVYWDGNFNGFGLVCGINVSLDLHSGYISVFLRLRSYYISSAHRAWQGNTVQTISKRLLAPWLSQNGSEASILM